MERDVTTTGTILDVISDFWPHRPADPDREVNHEERQPRSHRPERLVVALEK